MKNKQTHTHTQIFPPTPTQSLSIEATTEAPNIHRLISRHVGLVWGGVCIGARLRALGVEALHLHRLIRQRHVALSNRRRVRTRATCLPHNPRNLRAGSPQPEKLHPRRRRIPTEPRFRREARDARGNRRPRAAVHNLRGPRPQGDRDGGAWAQPREGE